MIQITIDSIFVVIWITMLTVQIGNLSNMGVMSCLVQGGLRSLNALVCHWFCSYIAKKMIRNNISFCWKAVQMVPL